MEQQIAELREKIHSDGGGILVIIEPPDSSIATREYVYCTIKNKFDWHPGALKMITDEVLDKVFPS